MLTSAVLMLFSQGQIQCSMQLPPQGATRCAVGPEHVVSLPGAAPLRLTICAPEGGSIAPRTKVSLQMASPDGRLATIADELGVPADLGTEITNSLERNSGRQVLTAKDLAATGVSSVPDVYLLPLAALPLGALAGLLLARKRLHGDVPRWWSPNVKYALKLVGWATFPLWCAMVAPALVTVIVKVPCFLLDYHLEKDGTGALVIGSTAGGVLAFIAGAIAAWGEKVLKPGRPG